ncbi:MAG: hypothetical protein H6510_10465 [Acidobacteria bacterium]|nr:hypothetical protein [Acidobacteriota bacterium]MCB9398232.1 hypothetical protein [Acidobacteriota bacterium]
MSHPKDELRNLYQKHFTKQSTPCPDTDRLCDLIVSPSADGLDPIREHVLVCVSCATDFKELLSIHRVVPSRRHSGAYLLAGAALLILAVLAHWIGQTSARVAETFRSSKVSRAIEPLDGSRLNRLPTHFDWPDLPNVAGYELIVYNTQGQKILKSGPLDQSECQVDWPKATSGYAFAWEIKVLGPSNPAQLGPFIFFYASGQGP